MKKTMKKFAAIIAAMMTVSALSSMSAFATPTIIEDANDTTAQVPVKVALITTDTRVPDGMDVWNVAVDTTALEWTITKNIGGTLHWDPSSHTYTTGTNNVTYKCDDGSFYTAEDFVYEDVNNRRIINVTNNSNFGIAASASISDSGSYGTADWFTVKYQGHDMSENDFYGIGTAANPSDTISEEFVVYPEFEEILADWQDIGSVNNTVQVGTITFSFTKGNNT